MYDRQFFATPLGRAALASIAAMTVLVAFSGQLAANADAAILAAPSIDAALSVELA